MGIQHAGRRRKAKGHVLWTRNSLLFVVAHGPERLDPRAAHPAHLLSGALLVVIYVGRLTQVIDPADRIPRAPPVLFGLIVNRPGISWSPDGCDRPGVTGLPPPAPG